MKLQPVLVPIPQVAQARTPTQIDEQRRSARVALADCARRSGGPEDGWEKNAVDVPIPNAGFHWSLSHKRLWAAAVVGAEPVGIDIEHIIPRPRLLHTALAHDDEWDVLGDRSWRAFYRLWTAKEATLKAMGIGLAGLTRCRLAELVGENRMMLEIDGGRWTIEHFFHDQHVAAVTCGDSAVEWHLAKEDSAKM